MSLYNPKTDDLLDCDERATPENEMEVAQDKITDAMKDILSLCEGDWFVFEMHLKTALSNLCEEVGIEQTMGIQLY